MSLKMLSCTAGGLLLIRGSSFRLSGCGALILGLGVGSLCPSLLVVAQHHQDDRMPSAGIIQFQVKGELGSTPDGIRTVVRSWEGHQAVVFTAEQHNPGELLLSRVVQASIPAPATDWSFDQVEWLESQGIRAQFIPDWVMVVDTGNGTFERLHRRLRQYQSSLGRRFARVGDTKAEGLMMALATGNKDVLSWKEKKAFSGLGIAHLTAVSGFHVGLVGALVMLVLKLFGAAQGLRGLAAIPVVWLFVGVCGFSGSAVRAGLMLTLAAFASFFHRRPDGLTLLSSAGCAMLALAPHLAANLGVRMSFLATAGILLWVRRWRRIHVKGWRGKGLLALGIPVVATAFTAPVAWPAFGQFPALFLPANTLATPITPVLMGLIFIWTLMPEPALHLLAPTYACIFRGAVSAVECGAAFAPPLLLPLDQGLVRMAGLTLCIGTLWALTARKGMWVFLGSVLLCLGLLRFRQAREMESRCIQVREDWVCIGGHPPEAFTSRSASSGRPLKWETRSFLERVSHEAPAEVTWCGDGLASGWYHLRYRHSDGTWQHVSSSRSHCE